MVSTAHKKIFEISKIILKYYLLLFVTDGGAKNAKMPNFCVHKIQNFQNFSKLKLTVWYQ